MGRSAHPVGTAVTRREAISFLAAGLAAASMQEGVGLAQETTRFDSWVPPTNGYKNLSGNNVYYEEAGQGIPVILTSAGMYEVESTRIVAEKLAPKYRVIGWDRANIGRSDIVFKGSRDCDLWADQLAELIVSLKAAPAYLAGCSAGMRTSFHTAWRYPDLVKGLIMWQVSALVPGNPNAPGDRGPIWQWLPQLYFGQYADLAEKEGMTAVAKQPYWARMIKRNPNNAKRLLDMDPREFVRVVRRWQAGYRPDDAVIQISEADCRKLNATGMPLRIIVGCDTSHSRAASELLAKLLPSAEFVDPPEHCAGLDKVRVGAQQWAKARNEESLAPHFEAPLLPQLIDEFITRSEARLRR